jgi:predicted nuclease of predicted toxin-antitoxin system
MAERIRFHLDEQVDPDVARALRRYGIDVTTTVEAGLRTSDDAAHLSFILREGRVVVTHDADFLRYAGQTDHHPGIVFTRMGARTLGEIIRGLTLIYEVLTPDDMIGRVEFL